MKDNPNGKYKVCAFDFRVSLSLRALKIKYIHHLHSGLPAKKQFQGGLGK